MPVAVAMLSAVIEHKIPTLAEVVALTVLSIGVMIAVWEGSVTGSVTGLILCIAALFSNAAMISTTGKVRRQASHYDQAVPQGLCCNRHATVKLDHGPIGCAPCCHGHGASHCAPIWHCCSLEPMQKVAQLVVKQSTGV